jgi:autotransporter adhesin
MAGKLDCAKLDSALVKLGAASSRSDAENPKIKAAYKAWELANAQKKDSKLIAELSRKYTEAVRAEAKAAAANASRTKYKVGQTVWVKYDIEQAGRIERIQEDRYGPPRYYVRVHEGGYVNNRRKGELVPFDEDSIWND